MGMRKSWLKWKQVYEINYILVDFGNCKEILQHQVFSVENWWRDERSHWNGIEYPKILVRHEDARCQWMRVPPEKLSVHLGSYLDSRVGRPSGWSSGGRSPPWAGCKPTGHNESEPWAGLESKVVDADPPYIRGRPKRDEEETEGGTRLGPPG